MDLNRAAQFGDRTFSALFRPQLVVLRNIKRIFQWVFVDNLARNNKRIELLVHVWGLVRHAPSRSESPSVALCRSSISQGAPSDRQKFRSNRILQRSRLQCRNACTLQVCDSDTSDACVILSRTNPLPRSNVASSRTSTSLLRSARNTFPNAGSNDS